jgi:alcohol oxidase
MVGWPEIEDLQSLDANNGVQRAMRYISPDGKRQDAASKYLHPRLQDGDHPNLHVLLETKIVRVLFDDDKRAIGVECKSGSSMSTTQIKARKLVIVSCGACGTPSVLERSGVGSVEILQRAGIPLVAEVPGVGEEYEDHELLSYPYKSSLDPGETLDAILSGRSNAQDLIKNNDPILGWNSMDITCKLRPSGADIEELGPGYKKTWDLDFKNIPDKPAVLMSVVNG